MEALLRLFIAAPVLPLSQKLYTYMPTDTRSMLRIVRTAAGGCGRLPGLPLLLRLRLHVLKAGRAS